MRRASETYVTEARKAPARTSLSQSQLIWRRFRKHRIASVGLVVLAGFFLIALFCDFLAPNPAARAGRKHASYQDQSLL